MLEFKQYQKTLKEYNYIDLFAGIGGFRLGLDYFGANCVFTSEWNKYASEVYFNNFGEMPEGDITKIKENHIPKHDIICAGFASKKICFVGFVYRNIISVDFQMFLSRFFKNILNKRRTYTGF